MENTLFVGFDSSGSGYKLEQMAAFHQRALERVKALPGVREASVTSPGSPSVMMTPRGFSMSRVSLARTTRDTVVHKNVIGPAYFETMGIPLMRGREFDSRDDASASKVAMINETLARFYFGDVDPVGKSVWMSREPSGPPITIVGVVADSKQKDLRDAPPRHDLPTLHASRCWRHDANEAGPQTGKASEFLESLCVWSCLAALRPRLVSVFGFADHRPMMSPAGRRGTGGAGILPTSGGCS